MNFFSDHESELTGKIMKRHFRKQWIRACEKEDYKVNDKIQTQHDSMVEAICEVGEHEDIEDMWGDLKARKHEDPESEPVSNKKIKKLKRSFKR